MSETTYNTSTIIFYVVCHQSVLNVNSFFIASVTEIDMGADCVVDMTGNQTILSTPRSVMYTCYKHPQYSAVSNVHVYLFLLQQETQCSVYYVVEASYD